ncbi:hypothetical protein HU200_057040 [Digitaria exilis]|uniref:At2g35280-like TPR domain-containing protein n=1 Tax=Digitaria exilis TaxID=1010633 RepID=A0A835E4P2_9POAL|nr:hypothetical protein HU200_057040 [Digitaria exilis]
MSSLQDLPLQLQESIAGLVAASFPQAMEDVRSLPATCKQMHRSCTSAHANNVDAHNFGLFRDTLLANLTRDTVGNPDACYLAGLREVFVDNHATLRPSPQLLERAAEVGHQLASYMLGICLYRRTSNAGDDDHTFWLIRKVQRDEDTGAAVVVAGGQGRPPMAWNNRECMRFRYTIRRNLGALLPVVTLVIWEVRIVKNGSFYFAGVDENWSRLSQV